jgi:hypothetical protein
MIKKILAVSWILFSTISFSQNVYEPIHSDVYVFLDLMAQKGIIQFHDEIRPVSRAYIAQKLLELKEAGNRKPASGSKLTGLEIEELEFYLKDFGMEITNLNKNSGDVVKVVSSFDILNKPVNKQPAGNSDIMRSFIPADTAFTTILSKDQFDRFRLFSYGDSLFQLNASPVLGYELGSKDGAKYSHRWDGLYMYGYLSDNIGFSFRFQDNSEDGTTIDPAKIFTPATGVVISKRDLNNIQYSEINANLAYNWSWGDLSIGKDFLNWGYGQSGLLVLSDKAPSFPFIRLDIHPVSWLRFNYIHAWLNSGVIDSSASYSTLVPGEDRIIFRSKYLASHTITLTPSYGLDISLGESIVYSDKLELCYLFPIMFFRSAEAFLTQGNDGAGGNSQFFLGVSSRDQIKNTHLYGTLFIDEITLEGLFNPLTQRNQIGFTLGGSVTDLPLDNSTFTLEYTKIYPYVYNNYIQTQVYQSSGYLLGDWIGDNADLIYASLNYRFIRGLQATVWGQYIRKGAEETVAQDGIQPQPPFLFGLRTHYAYLGAELKYEITHELFARFQYQTTKVSTQQPDLSFSSDRLNEFYVALYYGIQ